MTALVIERINRYCSADIDDQARRLQFRPGPDHRNPAIDSHAAWLPVTIGYAKCLSIRPGKMHVTATVRTEYASQSRCERCAGDIACEHCVDVPRQLRRQCRDALIVDILVCDMPGP